jgi:DNA mismatch repair ATPase MutS
MGVETRSSLDGQIAKAKAATNGAILLFRIGSYYSCFDEDAEVVANVIGFHLEQIHPNMLRHGVAIPRRQILLTDAGIARNISLLTGAGYRVALMDTGGVRT